MEARVGIEPAYTELQDSPPEDGLFFKYSSLLETLSVKTMLIRFA